MNLDKKYQELMAYLEKLGRVAVAFSGGVDSTFLARVAYDVLGENAIAVTATSSTYPEREFKEACELAKKIGITHIVIESEELDIQGFAKNPKNRCYYCKKNLFTKVEEVAKKRGIRYVADGSNFDDLGDFRPGMQAALELKVVSPLKQNSFTKNDIRVLSRNLDLPTWDKPAFACLSSRFPYGHEITSDKLKMVDQAEEYLLGLGFRQLRVRHHGEIARIEVAPKDIFRFFSENLIEQVATKFKDIGFTYVTLDLAGYRTGSMNEVLRKAGEI